VFGAAPEADLPPPATARGFVVPRDPDEAIDEIPAVEKPEGDEQGGATGKESAASDEGASDDGASEDGASEDGGRPVAGVGVPAGVGALRVADCRSVESLDQAAWRRLVTAAELDDEQRAWLRCAGIAQADHVAIDRWTGGAADKLLFTVAEPWDVAWEPIRLRLDHSWLTARLDQTSADAAVALVLLVLRDLQHGWLPLGGGTNRGLGDLADVTVTITEPADGCADQDTDGGGDDRQRSYDLDQYLASESGGRAKEAWKAWCRSEGSTT
jgi:hypothetical protein